MFDAIIKTFSAHANPSLAKEMKAYLRNQFEFFGIKTPKRREISKPFFKGYKSAGEAGGK
jgi:3-methyladenine DNA glycosylase AlkD